jgi:hydroxymethylpyrimidine pyrophosphatase-like HAD family hydrolase
MGIAAYLAANNIQPEQTMAFGDGENDIGMLKFVQFGIAMGNADVAVKQSADYVTASVDEDGIWKALTDLKLID